MLFNHFCYVCVLFSVDSAGSDEEGDAAPAPAPAPSVGKGRNKKVMPPPPPPGITMSTFMYLLCGR